MKMIVNVRDAQELEHILVKIVMVRIYNVTNVEVKEGSNVMIVKEKVSLLAKNVNKNNIPFLPIEFFKTNTKHPDDFTPLYHEWKYKK